MSNYGVMREYVYKLIITANDNYGYCYDNAERALLHERIFWEREMAYWLNRRERLNNHLELITLAEKEDGGNKK